MITGFPRIPAIISPRWLMEISCQLSYPLNSETATPLDTFRVYLFCSWAAWIAIPETTASDATIPTLISICLDFMSMSPHLVDEQARAQMTCRFRASTAAPQLNQLQCE